ncbi:DNA polymerase III subunit delta [compost metagenome]
MIPAFTLVWGDDTHKQRQFEEAFAAKVVDPGFAAMNLQVLDGDADASMVAASSATPPFGPGGRLVVVRNCRFFSGRKKEEDEGESPEDADGSALASLFEQGLPSGCHLLLIVEGKLDKRRALTKIAVAKATVREFSLTDTPWDQSGSANWISEYAQQLGVGIQPDAIKALIAATSGDRWRLESELAKLALYTDGAPITLNAVLTMSAPSEADVFAVLETLAQRDALGTIKGFQRLLTLDKPERVLATLSTMLRGWHKAKHLAERGLDHVALAQEMGWKPGRVPHELTRLKRWNSVQLQKALVALLEAELAIKTGRGRDQLALTFEVMVSRMLAS